jgi:hypothetical protein
MANLFWKLQCESKSVEPIDGWHFTSKQYFCDKYVDIIKVETQHCNLIKKFYVDLLDDTQHVSIAAMLVSRKTKAKKRGETALDTIEQIWAAKEIALERFEAAQQIERKARAEYEELLDLYLTRKEEEQENETNGIGKNSN